MSDEGRLVARSDSEELEATLRGLLGYGVLAAIVAIVLNCPEVGSHNSALSTAVSRAISTTVDTGSGQPLEFKLTAAATEIGQVVVTGVSRATVRISPA